MKTNILTKLSFFLLLLALGTANGWAKQQTFYYKYTAKTSTGNTTQGSVYASTNKDATPAYAASVAPDKVSQKGYVAPNITLYLWAKPANDYVLESWTGPNDTKIYGTDDGDGIYTANASFSASSTRQNSPTTVTYTANFKRMGVVRVFSDKGGAAYVSNITNTKDDDKVTLTAYNLFDYVFTGWEHNGTIYSTEKEIEVTVPDLAEGQHDDYTAKFEPQPVTYYRLKSDKGYYLSIVGNQGDVLKSSDNETLYGFKLNGTIKFVSPDNVQSDPSTILKITHGDYASGVYTGFDIEAQGIKLTDVMQAGINKAKESSSSISLTKDFALTWDGKGGYKIKNAVEGYFIQGVTNEADYGYFVAENYSRNDGTTRNPVYVNANNDTWYFEPVDGSSSTANLSVTAEKTIGDKYYATLFVDFPFQCAPGMKAYYVADIKDDIAECNTNGITNVHEFTPVILEWTAGSNYVVPINKEKDKPGNVVSTAIDNDWWKGCINLYTTGGANPSLRTCYFNREGEMRDAEKQVQFDQSTMRVLNVNNDNLVLDKNFAGTAMPSNKCFIEKSPVKDLYVVIFPLELDEASLALDEPHNAIYAEVHVLRSVAGPKNGEEWGNWSTLCLPFDLDATEIETLFGECELKALDHFWVTDDGTLHLRFKDASEIVCGQPYMIRVKTDIADLTLHDKWVNTEKLNNQHLATDDYTLDFQGSYVWLDGTSGNYVPRDAFIISNNLFYLVNSNVKMKGFRAYFMPEAKPAAKAPIRVMKFATEDKPTAIGTVSFDGLDDGPIYNTQGVRLNSMQRGINIVNGKKIIR